MQGPGESQPQNETYQEQKSAEQPTWEAPNEADFEHEVDYLVYESDYLDHHAQQAWFASEIAGMNNAPHEGKTQTEWLAEYENIHALQQANSARRREIHNDAPERF